MNHSTSRRAAKAQPQVEATMLVEGIDKKVIKCNARKAFTLGFATVKQGETFFLVRSERRENRYYVVHFSEARHCYQCSCGCGTCEHEHLKAVREYVMVKVVVPARGAEALPMTTPATVAEVKARKNKVAANQCEVEEAKQEILLEEKIAHQLSLLKSAKMDSLRYKAKCRGLDIKSRKRIDFINAIISSIRLDLERVHGIAA
jgi:hypothetical protein